ncbi:MAG: DUF1844 domain-containing protein [Acidobacteria bacterium]|nr:DUF1844 domain-containing protein [Acidobacteriota bacterium]MCI0621627.1 DUF1844 domain-containing protein [Acidobacteriota bacterium]MCI0723252.1 DUF1844 domain-containing protein [Acidobacteriota bacterium]
MEKEESGFKVADRRLFTAEGELRDTEPETPVSTESSVSPGFPPLDSSPSPASADEMPMTFEALIFSLSTTALLQLGMAPHPETGKQEKDLPGAKQTIDILEILQEKTRGNLTSEEAHLLEDCVYDLKMTYVRALKGMKP